MSAVHAGHKKDKTRTLQLSKEQKKDTAQADKQCAAHNRLHYSRPSGPGTTHSLSRSFGVHETAFLGADMSVMVGGVELSPLEWRLAQRPSVGEMKMRGLLLDHPSVSKSLLARKRHLMKRRAVSVLLAHKPKRDLGVLCTYGCVLSMHVSVHAC